MGTIQLKGMSSARVEDVYAAGRGVYDYIEHMPNIKAVEIREVSEDGCFSKAEWILDLKLPIEHGKLSWVQEMRFDDVEKSCHFRISPEYSGVVRRFDGAWRYLPKGEGTELRVEMEFFVEHPLVTPFVQKIFDGIMKKNNEVLLRQIVKKAEGKR